MNKQPAGSTASKLAILALALSGFAAQAQQPDLQAQADAAAASPAVASESLQGVVVTGNSNVLLRADQRIALLSASLPLDAGDGVTHPSQLRRVAALFPQSPNAAAGEARWMMQRGQVPPAGPDADGDLALGTR